MKKRKFNDYKQGVFHPLNPDKYKGTTPIVYRSDWERHLMIKLDTNHSCISWGSESCVINYIKPTDKKQHRYFIDFTATFKTKSGELKKFYIEVKPYKQTIQPVMSKNKKKETFYKECETYAVNSAKWKSAMEFANKKGATFLIMTEKDLFI